MAAMAMVSPSRAGYIKTPGLIEQCKATGYGNEWGNDGCFGYLAGYLEGYDTATAVEGTSDPAGPGHARVG